MNQESLVHIDTNRYSVPTYLKGHTLTARIHLARIDLYDGLEQVASHPRQAGRYVRVVVPEHFEAVFAKKPRAGVMLYRDWMVGLLPDVATYVSQVCHKYYDQMESQILHLYALDREVGEAEFVAAVELAAEQQAIGADYLNALVHTPQSKPHRQRATPLAAWVEAPPQADVERARVDYERYIANPVGRGEAI